MKSILITIVITLLTVSLIGVSTALYMDKHGAAKVPVAASAPAPTIAENPKITKITPEYTSEEVTSKTCKMVNQTQNVPNTNKDGTMGGVVGGTTGAVAGGVIGKQIGGNTAGTLIGGAVGLIGGAIAGNKIQKANEPSQVAQTKQVKQCKPTTKTVQKIAGYNIEYIYRGQHGSVFMNTKPTGESLPLSAIS
jgi:uncharacterized protein YcfJ